jgi:hypothetical protein
LCDLSPSSPFSEVAAGVQLCPQEDLTFVESTQLGLGDIKSDQKVSAVTEITNGTEKGTPVRRNPGRAAWKSKACFESLTGKKSPWRVSALALSMDTAIHRTMVFLSPRPITPAEQKEMDRLCRSMREEKDPVRLRQVLRQLQEFLDKQNR